MAFWDIFNNNEKKAKLSHLKNLVMLTMADGHVDDSELATIASVMSREGLSEEDLQRCFENPKSIDFVAPDTEAKKIRYIRDMVCLMMVDGDLHENEYLVCKLTAEALGYKHEVVDAIIEDVVKAVKRDLQRRY